MERFIHRARMLLCYLPFPQVCQRLTEEDGTSLEEAYCAAVAAKILNESE